MTSLARGGLTQRQLRFVADGIKHYWDKTKNHRMDGKQPSRTLGERILGSFESPGMPRRRLAGGYIDDLAVLGKCILLCDFCVRKFNSRKAGYGRKRQVLAGHQFVLSTCDGCRRQGQCSMFLKETPK